MAFQVGLGTGVIRNVDGPLSVNATAIGNIGAGPDDLHTYTFPANALTANGGKLLAWKVAGNIANNANTKTISFVVGVETLISFTLPTSIAGKWSGTVLFFRDGTSRWGVELRVTDPATGTITPFASTGNLTTNWAINNVIKVVAATATADNDIVQRLSIISVV